MKSSTAPSGGSLPSSGSGRTAGSCESGGVPSSLFMGTMRISPWQSWCNLLEQRRELLELRSAGHSQEVEDGRLRAGQDGACLVAEREASLAIFRRARNDRVLREEDGEAAAREVAHSLIDADVGLHARDDDLLAAALQNLAGDGLVAAAGELQLLQRRFRNQFAQRRQRRSEAFRVLLAGDDRNRQPARGLDQNLQVLDQRRLGPFWHGLEQPLLHVDDEQQGVGAIKREIEGFGGFVVMVRLHSLARRSPRAPPGRA